MKKPDTSRLAEIKKQIEKTGFYNTSKAFGKREIRELPNILSPDETIDHFVQGFYDNGQGILVCTNRRILFINKGLIYGLKVEDFSFSKIQSIAYETGLMWGKIKIQNAGKVEEISQVDKKQARGFSEFVRKRLEDFEKRSNSSSELDIVSQIEKLAVLKEKGLLTQTEFENQKKKLLEKI